MTDNSEIKTVSITDEEALRRKTVRLFTLEGVAAAIAGTFNSSNANLMMTRLNATDYQLSLMATLTSLIGMFTLIPAAIFTDRLKNKRKMLVVIMFFTAACYLMAAGTPFLGSNVASALLIACALAGGAASLSNAVWQAYFADAIAPKDMNRTYSRRNLASFLIHMPGMLATGAILTAATMDSQKIHIHQIFFVLASVFLVLQVLILLRIPGGASKFQTGKKLSDVWEAAKDLAKNRRFLFFAVVVIMFYITWRMDGTIFYLSQVKYLGLSEFWLSASNAATTVAQIISIPIWTKLNERMGVRFGLIFGAFGLVLSPLCIVLPLSAEGMTRIILHVVLRFVVDFSFTTVTLNLLQNLLQVIPEKNRTLSIAVYNTLIAIVGSFMPMVGVRIYTAFGADQTAMVKTMLLMGGVRIISLLAMIYRWYVMREEGK